ncbi:MAG: TetR/AcrR family transcriptional regulator [Bacteroidota bacterium]
MVAIIHNSGNAKKQDAILSAAQKRLGLYGFEKTTMSEIAADLNLSKASLYYYFPDKESLWCAVLDKEQDEFFSLMNSRLKEYYDPETIISEFVKWRHGYFTTFLNLTKFRFSDRNELRPHYRTMIDKFRKHEEQQVTGILKQGVLSGVFDIENPEQTARMFLEILHGLRLVVVRQKPMVELTGEDYDNMLKKQQDFIALFIRSVKNHNQINPKK